MKQSISPTDHNNRPVKSLTRTSDKDAGARNSYTSDWKDRNWRKLKGDAKNDDVEKRWREISKVGGVEEVYLLSLSLVPPLLRVWSTSE